MKILIITILFVTFSCQSQKTTPDLTPSEIKYSKEDRETYWRPKGKEQKWVLSDNVTKNHKQARNACFERKEGQTWLLPTAAALEKAIEEGILDYIKQVKPNARYVWVDGIEEVTFDLREKEIVSKAPQEPHEFLCYF